MFIAGNARSLKVNEDWSACVRSAAERNMMVDVDLAIERSEDWDKIFGVGR